MRKLTLLLALAILASAPAERRGAEVHIVFSGVIAHVFDGAHAPRAVAMRGMGSMLHHPTLHIPQASIVSSDVPLDCDGGDCVLELRDTALRFPGGGRANYAAGGSFDTIVPHLRAVTNGEMSALRDEVFDPTSASVISASMELPAGRLSANAFDMKGRYDPDFENRGERPFAREVLLDGVVPKPLLLARRFGDTAWSRITFKDDTLIELRMLNDPAPGITGENHEMLFYDLSAQPLTTQPAIVRAATKFRANRTDIECSNSQWP